MSFKPSKKQAKEFALKMQEIDNFCQENGIAQSRTNDSYYFYLNNIKYRVSNHTIQASNRGAFDEFGNQIREVYHKEIDPEIVEIRAGKTRIIEIFNALKSGKRLDKCGKEVWK